MNKRSGLKRSGLKRSGHKRKGKKSTRGYRKGSKSKTMKGKRDFSTKKSSKVFNRHRHYQKHAKGSHVNRRPYHKRGGDTAHHKPAAHKLAAAHTHTHKLPAARRLAATPPNPAGILQMGTIVTGFKSEWANQPWMKKGVTPPYNTKGLPSAKAAIAKINNLDISANLKRKAIAAIDETNSVYGSKLQTKWDEAYTPYPGQPLWWTRPM